MSSETMGTLFDVINLIVLISIGVADVGVGNARHLERVSRAEPAGIAR